MAKPILSKSASPSNPYPYSPYDVFIAQVNVVTDEIQHLIKKLDLYPHLKNHSKIKNLVKISPEFVKICSTQEGV